MFATNRLHATLLLAGLLLVLSALLPSITAVYAAQQQGSSVVHKGEKVDITADNMEVFEKDNRFVFTGNVKLVKGDTTVYADKLEVFTAKEKQKDGTEKDKVREVFATGNVRIVKPDMTITGEKAFLDVEKDTATVEGNVMVVRKKATIQGKKLIANLKTNVTRVLSEGQKRVHGVFQR